MLLGEYEHTIDDKNRLTLPARFRDSFADGVSRLIEQGQHNRIQFNNLSILPNAEMADAGYSEKWITYGTKYYSAKELTVLPGRTVTIQDPVAYGMILVEGVGTLGKLEIETPSLIRFGQMTKDELFVTACATGAAPSASSSFKEPTVADMVLVLCILMSAYFIRGITGFGSGLISVPLLALSQPLQFAIPLVLALDFTASVVLGSTNRKKANWSEIKILLPAGMIGACIGAFALLSLPTQPVLVALGAFTMFVGFQNIFGLQPVGRLSRSWAIPAGLAGGGAGALFGVGSPPYIIYLTRRLQDKSEVRATFSWLIAIDGGFRLGLFLIAGLLLEPKLQLAYALGLVPMALGLYIGNKVHMDITSEGMLRVVGALLMLSGLMLFLKVAT